MSELVEVIDVAAKITERTIRDRMVRSVFSPYTDLLAFNLCGLGRYTHEMTSFA